MTRMVGIPAEGFRIGMAVRARFEPAIDGPLPVFASRGATP